MIVDIIKRHKWREIVKEWKEEEKNILVFVLHREFAAAFAFALVDLIFC